MSQSGRNWTIQALCAKGEPETFFVKGAAQRDAIQPCLTCPVRLECLADALDNQILYGVWGGMTERQRRATLKKNPQVKSWRAVLEQARACAEPTAGRAMDYANRPG